MSSAKGGDDGEAIFQRNVLRGVKEKTDAEYGKSMATDEYHASPQKNMKTIKNGQEKITKSLTVQPHKILKKR
eukprot:11251493-Karenia_brevis.AAC.1